MSRSVWVAFEYGGTKRQMTVDELGDSDDIDQLRKRFKAQEELQIGASLMNVFEVGEGDQKNELEPDTGLGKYFKPDREPDEGYGPGQSKKTALWIEIPNQQELNVPPASSAAAAAVNHHVNVAKGVFLLYRGDDSNAEPIGTAFVISKDLLLTACHNVVVQEQGEFSVVTELKVSPRLIKSETGSISTGEDQRGISVHVYRYNTEVDWACLRRDDDSSDSFPFIIPVATDKSDIPEEATTDRLFIYHCPIQPFFDDITMEVCHVMVKPAAVGIVGTKTIGFQNGAFPGSCGGPYMYQNKAIALHVDSVSTTKTAEDFKNETSSTKAGKKRKLRYDEISCMVADSCVSSHASMGSGILLHLRSGIMELLKDD